MISQYLINNAHPGRTLCEPVHGVYANAYLGSRMFTHRVKVKKSLVGLNLTSE